MPRVMRWAVVVLLAGATLAILLVQPRRQAVIPPGRVVVSYWEKWSGREREQMQVIVDDFNRTVGAEKNIYVDFLSLSGVDQKTRLAMAAGVPPDVAGVWDQQFPQFAAMDALEPLDDLAREFGIAREHYKPVYWDACRFRGRLYAIPNTPATIALHYNKRIFREKAAELRAAGCDPDRAPRTFAELDRYAAAIDTWATDSNGRKFLRVAGYFPTEPGWYLRYTWLWFGGKVFDEATQALTLDTPEARAAYEWVAGYSKRLGKQNVADFKSGLGGYASTQNPFLTGEVAMIQQGPWMVNTIEAMKPSMNQLKFSKDVEMTLSLAERRENYEWAVAPFPIADGIPPGQAPSLAPLDVLAIPRGAKHKREAFEFLAYLSRQDVMEKLCALHCKNSPLATVSEQFVAQHPNPYIGVFEDLARNANAYCIPQLPIWPQVSGDLQSAIDSIVLQQQTPAVALAEVQARTSKRWAEYQAVERRRVSEEADRRGGTR